METVDPRHGRWILPLLVLAMVVLTYTFVNSLEPSDNPTGTTSAEPPFPTDGTSTTTSLPPEIASFMVTIDIFENQATAFRDAFPRFGGLDAVILGVSPDSVAKQAKFKEKYGLPFTLLADKDHAIAASLAKDRSIESASTRTARRTSRGRRSR